MVAEQNLMAGLAQWAGTLTQNLPPLQLHLHYKLSQSW